MSLPRWLLACIMIVALGVPLALQTAAVASNGYLAGDFRAFYCASRLASERQDPYRAAPLHACEVSAAPSVFFTRNPNVTVPAPLPGYALAFIAPLARLPFGIAASMWTAIAIAAIVISIVSLQRVSGFALPLIVAALTLSVGMTSLPFGENIPIAIAALCVCAWFAAGGRWRAASVAACIAMIEPQLGLAACLGLFIWVKQSRAILCGAAFLFAIVSLWLLGPTTNLEYVLRVVPAQALSEAARDTQYSLSTILIGLGTTHSLALRIAAVQSLLLVICGILVGRLLAQRYANDAFLVLIPAAFAVIGGSYVHITQIAAAIPAATLLLRYAGRSRSAVLTGMVVLTVPWLHAPFLVTAFAVPVALLIWELGERNARLTMASALVTLLFVLGVASIVAQPKTNATRQVTASTIDPDLPQASWSQFSGGGSSTEDFASWAERLPTWIGLLLIACGGVAESRIFDRRSHKFAEETARV
jgi:hypothetical protein